MEAEDGYRAAAWFFDFGRDEGTAEERGGSEDGEVVVGNHAGGELGGRAAGVVGVCVADADVRGEAGVGGDSLEGAGVGFELTGEVPGDEVVEADVDAAVDACRQRSGPW